MRRIVETMGKGVDFQEEEQGSCGCRQQRVCLVWVAVRGKTTRRLAVAAPRGALHTGGVIAKINVTVVPSEPKHIPSARRPAPDNEIKIMMDATYGCKPRVSIISPAPLYGTADHENVQYTQSSVSRSLD